MSNNINEEIRLIRDNVILRENLISKVDNMKIVFKAQEEELEVLRTQLEKEHNDVKKLEGISLSSLFAKMAGNKEEKLQKEEQEYFMAKMKYDECFMSVNSFKDDISSLESRLELLGNCEKELNAILKVKREELKLNGNPNLVVKIDEKECEINSLTKEYIEIKEAIDACEECRGILNNALESLESAKGWGTYDIIAGDMVSSMIKHNKIDKAKTYLNKLTYSIKKLGNELDDISLDLPVGDLNISNFDYTFDVFFDNIFSDFSVQNKIEDAVYKLKDGKEALNKLNLILNEKMGSVEKQVSNLKSKLDEIIINM